MPVTVIVGGQFGSEGKGKVAYWLADKRQARVAIRVGGPNSGHTAIDERGQRHIFRQLPTPALLPSVHLVLPPGAYIDPDLLLQEISQIKLEPERLLIDPCAALVQEHDRQVEKHQQLQDRIGSTQTGTGSAVASRALRDPRVRLAKDDCRLSPYLHDTRIFLRQHLRQGTRIILEGTQGYGLSLLHSGNYPYTTSRDTSAAGFIMEAGLSPMGDVDEIFLVIRSFPIRVPGFSGDLPRETDWETITRDSGAEKPIREYTSVTNRLRKVARFHPGVVRAALEAHPGAQIVLNHLDYVDAECDRKNEVTAVAAPFVDYVERELETPVSYCGVSPSRLVPYHVTSRTGD